MMKQFVGTMFIFLCCIAICLSVFFGIKYFYFKDMNVTDPLTSINSKKYIDSVEATTKVAKSEEKLIVDATELPTVDWVGDDVGDKYIIEKYSLENLPYPEPPEYVESGSIMFSNQQTMTDVVNKINKFYNNSYLKNTGLFFAQFSYDTGINPYMLAAITAAEQGCNTTCNAPAIENNNLFGMLYYKNGSLYHCRYNTLEEGLNAFFLNVYYLYGLYGYENATYSVEELTNKWNPSGGENYRNIVIGFMNQIQSL